MNLLERIRRFWSGDPGEDHPLTAEERAEDRPFTAFDERAQLEQRFVGGDLDPDERGHR